MLLLESMTTPHHMMFIHKQAHIQAHKSTNTYMLLILYEENEQYQNYGD